jgi:hypothetical protein
MHSLERSHLKKQCFFQAVLTHGADVPSTKHRHGSRDRQGSFFIDYGGFWVSNKEVALGFHSRRGCSLIAQQVKRDLPPAVGGLLWDVGSGTSPTWMSASSLQGCIYGVSRTNIPQ